MKRPLRVLLVEDSEDDASLVLRELQRGGFEVSAKRVETEAAMREALVAPEFDLVLSDYSLPTFSAPEALAIVRDSGIDVPFIMLSGTVDEAMAVGALKAGAADFITKQRLTRLVPAVDRELREAAIRKDRRILEQHVQQAQKMEAIGRVAGGIAHDFNNMLAVILNCSEIVASELAVDDPHRNDLLSIMDAARRAATLTRQLLAFSRRQVVQIGVVSLNQVIDSFADMTRRLVGEAIRVERRLAADLGSVRADPAQVEQVLMNLVVNARDAMPDGGHITIETQNIAVRDHVDAARNGRYVMLSVADNGVGMDDTTRAHLFEPFFTTKPVGRGTGLGLATLYAIVQQGGGYVTVESAPLRGSTFRVYLPRIDDSIRPPAFTTSAARSREEVTVLVVDDDPPLRAVIDRIVRKAGYRTIVAADGERALALAKTSEHAPDIVVSDVQMARMDGVALAQALRAWRPSIGVLFVTAYGDLEGRLPAGASVLAKPFTPISLIEKLGEALAASIA